MGEPYYADNAVTLYHGDALAVLATLPAGSVDCCVTSPPYSDPDVVEFLHEQEQALALSKNSRRQFTSSDLVDPGTGAAGHSSAQNPLLYLWQVLGSAQCQACFGLRPLDSQVRQQCRQCVGRHAIGRLPVVERSALGNARRLNHERSTERLLKEQRDLWRDLFETDPLCVERMPSIADPHRVGRTADTDRSIGVDRTSQVGRYFLGDVHVTQHTLRG